ncbi:MAG: hemG, partial [Cohnella sp.]|nr:hemG [Cohnella sp.]
MTNIRKAAVLGGGITGLAAAFYLYRMAAERGERIEVTLYEGSARLGGRVNTLRR